ncbi:MAG TPA: glycosyltransferase [Candidatus Saccharimonadales bacterium]
MRVVVTGGGSGGHITPVLAVAQELKALKPDAEIFYIIQKGENLSDVVAAHSAIDKVYSVPAGKLRRYHGEGLKQLLDAPTVAKNTRDVFRTVKGLWQSYVLLKRLKPDVVFIKGGFVGVPVGLAAAALKIPYVTHDSDALPGLANRIVAPWARMHAVALPKEIYAYPPAKTVTVGVPISQDFHLVSARDVVAARKQIGLEKFSKVICLTGGGNGSETVNNALVMCAPDLLERYNDLAIVHIAGRSLEADLRQQYQKELGGEVTRVFVKGFVTNMHEYSAAADVVVTRAGGTSMAEFATQGKPCVVIPSPFLAGGHQLKNAKVLQDRKAVKVLDETLLKGDPKALMAPLTDLLDHPDKAHAFGQRLAELAAPDAAKHLAMVLLDVAKP